MIRDIYSPYYGIIVDTTTLKPISIPPLPCIKALSNKKITEINKALSQELCDIIKIEDGTMVTLYSWIHPQNGRMWAIASNNGYDISSYKWMGKLTYAEIFYDLVDRLYPAFKAQTGMDILYIAHTNDTIKTILTFTNLDHNFCYTIGFRHHDFHPMKADSEKIWQVQYVDLRVDSEYTIIHGGFFPADILPIQAKCEYSAIGKGPITIKNIELKCMSSFINAYLYINKNYIEDGSTIEDDNQFVPQYGYIIRYNGESILIKSPLLKMVEKLIYKYHKDYKIYSENLNHLNKMQYIAMRAFLKNGKGDINTSCRQQFILLFPEWSSKFADFDKFTSNLIEKIASYFSQNKEIKASKKELSPIDNLSYRLYLIIKKDYKLTLNYEEVISNYVHNPEYAFIYINFI